MPRSAPPSFESDVGPASPTPTDASQDRDLGLMLQPVFDASPPQIMVDTGLVEDEWSAYSVVLVVDRTGDDAARSTPALPGADIDAVEVLDSEDRVIGVADSVIDSRINDPYEANIQAVPRSALGRADVRAVSLGTQGGFVRLSLTTDQPITAQARLRIVEIEEEFVNEDAFEIFLCRADSEGLSGCRSLGTSESGTVLFDLD